MRLESPNAYKQLIIIIAAVYKKLAAQALVTLVKSRSGESLEPSSAALVTDIGLNIYQTYIAQQDLPVEQVLASLYEFVKKFVVVITQMSSEDQPASFPVWFKMLWLKLPLTVVFVILRVIRFVTTYEPTSPSYGGFGGSVYLS